MSPRVSWNDLPAALRGRVEAEAGTFEREEQVAAGHNCLVGMILHTALDTFFLKGVPADHARAVWTQANEAAVNEYLRPVTPALAFHVQAEGWDILGFQHLAGYRHADLSPGSPDLPRISATLHALSEITAPRGLRLRTIEDRWRGYGGRLSLLAGPALVFSGTTCPDLTAGDRRAGGRLPAAGPLRRG